MLTDTKLQNPSVQLGWMDEESGPAALERLQTAPSCVSVVDTGSFAIMERLGATRAFAFDKDFSSAGYRLE